MLSIQIGDLDKMIKSVRENGQSIPQIQVSPFIFKNATDEVASK